MPKLVSLSRLKTYVTVSVDDVLTKLGVAVPRNTIDCIVERVYGACENDKSEDASHEKLRNEIKALATYIRQTKEDIVSLQPGDINTTHLRAAKSELDAVIGATEEAANKIMDVADEITGLANSLEPEARQKLIDCATRIYEASNFQDITGQRITKVVSALKYIDMRVDTLLKILNNEIRPEHAVSLPDPLNKQQDALLNGPQLPGNAMDQNSIDRLLDDEGTS